MKITAEGIVELTKDEYDVLNLAYNIIGMIGTTANELKEAEDYDSDDAEKIIDSCVEVLDAMDILDNVVAIEGYGIV